MAFGLTSLLIFFPKQDRLEIRGIRYFSKQHTLIFLLWFWSDSFVYFFKILFFLFSQLTYHLLNLIEFGFDIVQICLFFISELTEIGSNFYDAPIYLFDFALDLCLDGWEEVLELFLDDVSDALLTWEVIECFWIFPGHYYCLKAIIKNK